MPSKNMNDILKGAAKYASIIPDEAGHLKNMRPAALHGQLQSLIKGEPLEKPGDSFSELGS